jgi:hypothetical protein
MSRTDRYPGQQVIGTRVAGNLFQIQGVSGDVTVHAGPVVRSAYLEQVRRIAPPQLRDRDGELTALAAFCIEPDQGTYVWWRASAWAGKSALMSWFVLHPPPGVRVVSFFITARYKGQDDRVAFTDAVMEQLADMLGQPMPAYMTEATRETHLLGMLAEAAEGCHGRGERLVLVVDGLDEDRGVTTGPDAYSIAALLPARPPAGLAVAVASRPDPPIPEDVPDDHPLRDPGIVRELGRSHWAEVVRTDMQRELKRLLHGTQAEQDLLGLVAAAGGGLSAKDLAELASLPLFEVEENLNAVAGRTFSSRASRWQLGTAPPVYVLGHEELQGTATEYLGKERLNGYRERLHTWAKDHRQRGWPAETPEYLLRGYFRMLQGATDIPRLVACATDQARHDRMLDVTGGDTAAISEITDAQDVLLSLADPDLPAIARLAVHRISVTERNANIPAALPTVWAMAGHLERAEALAHAMTYLGERVEVLANVAQVASHAGYLDRARALAERAEVAAQAITDPEQRALALTNLARTAAGTFGLDQAEALAQSITDAGQRALAFAGLAHMAVSMGDLDRAEAIARAVTYPREQAEALAEVAQASAGAGNLDRAEEIAQAIAEPDVQARISVDLTRVAAEAGDLDRARALAERAETAARAITDAGHQAEALADLA